MAKIAILSNVTTSILANMLSRVCRVWNDFAFDSWYQISLDPPKSLTDFNPDRILILIDERFSRSVGDLSKAKESLRGYFPSASVYVPNIKNIAKDFGDLFYDERMWSLAKIPWSHLAHHEIFKLFSPKKVAAVDFDGTLYDGAITETPLADLAPNVCFLDGLKELKEKGVLLLGLTKNDQCDIDRLFEKKGFALSRDDFVEICANWNDKSENLKVFSQKYKLSLDSFVFFDDNSSERVRMRHACPEVTVASYPFSVSDYFPPSAVTEDDLKKHSMYRQEIERNALAAKTSLEEYFSELRLELKMSMLDGTTLERVFQLSQKTNRFNVTTNRYSRDEISAFLDDRSRMVFVFSAKDSFGDYGVVAFVNVLVESSSAEIVDWVMSCRAMGRTLEYAIEEMVEKALIEAGVSVVRSNYVDSGKNAPVGNLFEDFGYEVVETNDKSKSYLLEFPRRSPMKTHFVSICE